MWGVVCGWGRDRSRQGAGGQDSLRLQDDRRCWKRAVGSTGRERAVGSRWVVWMWIWQCEGSSWAVVGVACLCPRPIEL